jgi:hypothetical protein
MRRGKPVSLQHKEGRGEASNETRKRAGSRRCSTTGMVGFWILALSAFVYKPFKSFNQEHIIHNPICAFGILIS